MTSTPIGSCEHGQLARQCPHCKRAAEIDRLTADNAALRAGYNDFLGEVQHRLIQQGLNPPAWPGTIDCLSDHEGALDSCVAWCADRLRELTNEREKVAALERQVAGLREALEFYANVENYHAIGFLVDPPCGAFIEDFDFSEEYDRNMPGKRARAALAHDNVDQQIIEAMEKGLKALRDNATSDQMAALRKLVDAQANDAGLWFVAQTAPEAYLQRELRRLHGAIESAASGGEER